MLNQEHASFPLALQVAAAGFRLSKLRPTILGSDPPLAWSFCHGTPAIKSEPFFADREKMRVSR